MKAHPKALFYCVSTYRSFHISWFLMLDVRLQKAFEQPLTRSIRLWNVERISYFGIHWLMLGLETEKLLWGGLSSTGRIVRSVGY